jgi:hypothetical protein
MPASSEAIREKMNIVPTRDDKGLVMTLVIAAYDKTGIVNVDGRPHKAESLDPV